MGMRVTGWRKLAASSRGRPADPQFFGDLDLDSSSLRSYIEEAWRVLSVHVTMTHLGRPGGCA
jgi:hypothetical protein